MRTLGPVAIMDSIRVCTKALYTCNCVCVFYIQRNVCMCDSKHKAGLVAMVKPKECKAIPVM